MIYRGKQVEVTAFRYGIHPLPEWIKGCSQGYAQDCAGRQVLRIEQPDENEDLACGYEAANIGDFVVKTKGGSFQVYSMEHFYTVFFVEVDSEPVDN